MTMSTQHAFIPDANSPRLTTDEFRTRADAVLAGECPRLLHGGASALGEARFTLELTSGGDVRQAILDRSSGDDTIDKLFGGLSAQLHFANTPPSGATAPIAVGYSCSPSAAVATLDLDPAS